MTFGSDSITFKAGNEQLLQLIESTQDSVIVGDGGDVDFHVKATGSANAVNALFVQGSTGNIGMGTTTPDSSLELIGNISMSGALTSSGILVGGIPTTGASEIQTKYYSGDTLVKLHNTSDDGVVSVYQNNQEKIKLTGAGGHISASGNITASGDLTVDGGDINFNNLPTSGQYGSIKVGTLYTISGSQFLASGSVGTDARTKYNTYSGSKFVLIR